MVDYDREYTHCIRCGIELTKRQRAFCSKGCQIIWTESMGSLERHKSPDSALVGYDSEDENYTCDEEDVRLGDGYHIEYIKKDGSGDY